MTAPTELEVLRQELAEARGYADQQQRAVSFWRQVVDRIAEAMNTSLRDPEQLVELAGRLAATANTPYATLRDQFAVAALPAMLAAAAAAFQQGEEFDPPLDIAKAAYVAADAMLEARR
jgi:hypothetical protein